MAGRQLLLRRHRLLHGPDLRRSHGRADDRRPSPAEAVARPHERAAAGARGRGRDGTLPAVTGPQDPGLPGEARGMTRILFLPGSGASPDFWKPVGQLLPQAWSKEYFGWPGLGNQPHDPNVRGWDDLVRMVEARMDGPVDLVAQSMGGVIATTLALKRPQLVRRLVLTVTSGGVDMAGLGASDWRAEYRRL